MPPRPVRYYFAFSSSFSALANWRVDALIEAAGATLEPVPVVLPRTRAPAGALAPFHRFKIDYLMEDAARAAARLGMPWHPPEAALRQEWPGQGFVDGTDATAGWYLARERGCERAYRDAVFRACWCEGRDVGAADVLDDCATRAGLPAAALRAAIADPRYRAQVPAVVDACLADRVFGVPTFVLGTERFWGQDRLDALLAALAA